jgi:predicted negative regulator of RcsB-dependent stress response
MRCNYQLKKVDAAIESANKVLISDKVPEEVTDEAHFILAKSFLSKEDLDQAINEFKYITDKTNTKEGAEAAFRVAEILVSKNKLDEAETEILEYNKKNTPHQFWLARSIILLSDVYVAKGDDFQARHTLESIVQYYDVTDDGIIQLARGKLDEILEREEAATLFKEVQDLQLNFDGNKDGKNNELSEPGNQATDSVKPNVE